MTDTGLPELPEGYFWRVRPGALSITYVELRKKTWYGSRKIASRIAHYYDEYRRVLDPSAEILYRAEQMMDDFNDPWPPFYGDYPPKRLEEDN